MRQSAYSDAEIHDFVRDMDAGRPVEEICLRAGVSLRTLYRWRRKFGTLKPFAVQALRRLEQENHRLKAEVARRHVRGSELPIATKPRQPVRSDLGTGSHGDMMRGATVVGRFAALRVR